MSMGGMVWSGRELLYGVVTLMDVGDDPPAGEDMVGLTGIGVVVVEMEDSEIPQSVIWGIFENGGGR